MENRGVQLLSMTIEIGDGQQGVVKIHQFDDPEQLAHEFARAHSLNENLERNLVTLISSKKQSVQSRSVRSPDSFRQSELSSSRLSNSIQKSRSLQQSGHRKHSSATSFRANKKEAKLNSGQKMYMKGLQLKESQRKFAEQKHKEKEEALKAEVCTCLLYTSDAADE